MKLLTLVVSSLSLLIVGGVSHDVVLTSKEVVGFLFEVPHSVSSSIQCMQHLALSDGIRLS